MLGAESLSLGGWPIWLEMYSLLLEKHKSGQLMDLGGNMFAGTIIGALLATLIFELPWIYDVVPRATSDHKDSGAASALLVELTSVSLRQ